MSPYRATRMLLALAAAVTGATGAAAALAATAVAIAATVIATAGTATTGAGLVAATSAAIAVAALFAGIVVVAPVIATISTGTRIATIARLARTAAALFKALAATGLAAAAAALVFATATTTAARAGLAAIQERPHEDVFTPGLDGARLHARLYRVPNAHATVILCHGYHSRAEHDFGAQFPALYASGGCNLLLIDERAHGLSEGKCLTFGQLERYDIAQWVHWVREHSRVQRPIALYGVSMGAASVLLAAQLPELRGELACVVADCGYSSFRLEVADAVRHATNAPRWLQGPLARACVRILRRSGLDFDAVDTTPGMAALDIPILFFHGDADTFVPLHHSERNLAACRREQRLIVIPGAEHAMAAQVDPERYRRELLVFLWRNTNYLWAERNKPLK